MMFLFLDFFRLIDRPSWKRKLEILVYEKYIFKSFKSSHFKINLNYIRNHITTDFNKYRPFFILIFPFVFRIAKQVKTLFFFKNKGIRLYMRWWNNWNARSKHQDYSVPIFLAKNWKNKRIFWHSSQFYNYLVHIDKKTFLRVFVIQFTHLYYLIFTQ